MKGPTLGEVKDYFKEAGTVVCLSTRRNFDISKHIPKDIYENIEGCWVWINLKGSNCVVWNKEKGYAEILENRKYTITKDQLMIIHEKTSVSNQEELQEWFPEAFETVFNTGYYKHKNGEHPKWFSYANFETKEYYGRGVLGDWFQGNAEYHLKYITSNCEPMSTEEATKALKKEAVKRGFVDGAYFKHGVVNIPRRVYGQEFEYDTERNELRINGFTIILNGKWIAEIIPTKTIQEAEKLLNCKIV